MKKNYIKLIGSIMCAFSMIMTVAMVAIGAQANQKKIEYVENVKYEKDDTVPDAPEEVKDGYLFAGWYEKDGNDKYIPVEKPVIGTYYVAKYVPSEVLGIKAQVSGQIKDNDTDKIKNNKVDNAIRFITSLDSTEYNHIGFNIKIEGTTYDKDAATTKYVYKKLYGIGADKETVETYEPKDKFHSVSQYFKTYTFTTIPESAFDSYITVTPYWITLDGTRVDGPETAVKTVNYGRAWYYVDDTVADKNTKVPLGTVSNPYTTLADAMNVETELNPRLILKNDITVNETVNVAKTMTIAGLKTADPAKKITYDTSEKDKYIFTVAETGNITLEDLHLSGGYRAIQNSKGTVSATNVEITDCAEMCIRLDGGKADLTNVTITGGKRGLQLYSSAQVTGSSVNIWGPTENGIACGGASKLNITNLTLDGTLNGENKLTSNAMNVYGGSEVTVTGGRIQNIKNVNGVNAGLCNVTLNDVTITYNNAASNSDVDGIKAYYEASAKGSAVVNLNDVTINNAPRYGIGVSGGSQVTGDTVTINSSVLSGIKCTNDGSKFDITTLNVSNSKSHGVELTEKGTGSISGGTISNSAGKGIYLHKEEENGVTGATITLENYNINNSAGENLYLNDTSSATVNGTLTTNDGNTHSFAIYNASTLTKGDNYSKITINSPTGNGVRLYNTDSKLNVGDMEITGCVAKGIEVNQSATATLSGTVQIKNSTAENLYLHNKATVTVDGTLNMTGGNTYSLAVYGASTVNGDTNNSEITIATPKNYGVRIADANSLLKVGNMELTNCQHHGIYIENKGQAEFNGSVSIQGASSGDYDCLYVTGASSQATVNGTLTTTGGRYGLAIFKGGVVKGNDNSAIEITSPRTDGINIYDSESKLTVGDIILSRCSGDGIEMGSSAVVTLTGQVSMSSITGNGILVNGGELKAGTSTINITGGCNYGLRANGGTTTIGELNIDGAKAHSAVRAQAGTVTINCGIIRNSKQYGVNALGSAKLNMTNVTITNSKNADLIWQGTGYTLNLTNVKYDTSGKLSDDGKVLDQEATPNGTITNG